MSYTESKNIYKELTLIMENCEELSIPYKNVHGVEFDTDLDEKGCITDYTLSFVLDESCSLYMMHPDNGVDRDPSSILKRLIKWKDVTHLVFVDFEGHEKTYYVSSWESMGVDNDQEHIGQDVGVETYSDGTRYVRMTCKGKPSGLPKY